MNKIRVIDLLNKIVNGEEIDFLFKIGLWEYSPEDEDIEYELLNRLADEDFKLNDEIEIIEDKKIEKIPYHFSLNYIDSKLDSYSKEEINKTINHIYDKINEIIDYLEENK